jgi:hypothetical protein
MLYLATVAALAVVGLVALLTGAVARWCFMDACPPDVNAFFADLG